MTASIVEASLDRLESVARRHRCSLEARIRPGASTSNLDLLSEFIGAPVPKTLSEFLRRHDGVRIAMYTDNEAELANHRIEYHKLEVFGTKEIINATIDMRSCVDVESDALWAIVERCFDFASVSDSSLRTVFCAACPTTHDEYAIFSADLDTGRWLDEISDSSGHAIARSFNDFLDRAIEGMLEAESTFIYWSEVALKDNFWPGYPF